MRHSSPPPPPPTWSHAAGLRLSPPTPSVILAANLARVVCCLSFGSKLAKRQDAHGEAGQDEGRRQSWQTASSLSLATLIALRQRGESSQSACACIARMGKRNGTSGSGSGSPSAADATFGPWQLRAAVRAVVVVLMACKRRKKNPKKARAKNNKKRKSAEAMPRILNILTERRTAAELA